MVTRFKSHRRALAAKFTLSVLVLITVASSSIYFWWSSGKSGTSNFIPAHWPTTKWYTCTPEEEGFDSTKLAQGLQSIKQSHMNIHSLMIVRDGKVFLDAYFYPYDGSTFHDLASVTKSVITTLIGIAVDQGKLKLDDPVLSFFKDHSIANVDARKEQVTVRHLVSMTSGFRCIAVPNETTLDEMMASTDWAQFALDRPMAAEPGTRFVYDSLGMHLLSAILQRATGKTALEFAKENLFGPLGITEICWPTDPQGVVRGGGDLCLFPNDAAKIGLLFLTEGRWEDRQILSSGWIKEATSKQTATGFDRAEDYGYGWWISRGDLQYFRADGANGQRILVIPSMNLVLVTTGGGFSFEDIVPYIESSIVDLEKPIPANPTGVTQLKVIVDECKQPPVAQPVPPLPDIARAISGKIYVFEENPIQLQSIRVDFNDPSYAVLYLSLSTEESTRAASVGLDGVYRPSTSGRPSVARGKWTDDQTFRIEYSEGPGRNYYRFLLHFESEKVTFEISGLIKLEGKMVN